VGLGEVVAVRPGFDGHGPLQEGGGVFLALGGQGLRVGQPTPHNAHRRDRHPQHMGDLGAAQPLAMQPLGLCHPKLRRPRRPALTSIHVCVISTLQVWWTLRRQ
jgi:hypothetical protein